MTSAKGGERERILHAAIRLFAALGYDATEIGQIAEAAGLSTKAVSSQFGAKRDLYLAVMERAHRIHAAVVEARVKDLQAAPPEEKVGAIHRFIDAYIDFSADHPEVPALWMHRWLSDARDVSNLEAEYVQPLAEFAIENIIPATKAEDADVHYTINTLVWCVHGFVLSGVFDAAGRRRGPDDPRALRRFRAHMHQMIHRTLGLPGSPPPIT
ncbi:TetR/AcrR family transcriptional regulator [Nonomuraea sp. NPDC049152]|uniref:TetR/AcrR family transcriptional regulator n=1 Tax=Nonomuraea sp. NPDC049152 TaxID=3154350 RepID=UPI00340F986F